jgi:membrane protein DedA with SNARE-associated domain
VLAAAAFEMRFTHFLLAIFAGRFVRFLIEALLTLEFGPQIVWLAGRLFAHHVKWILAGAALLAVVWLILWRRKKPGGNSANKNAAGNEDPARRSKENSVAKPSA